MTKLTHMTKPLRVSEIKREWHLIDVKGKILGRTATHIARLLTGKNKVNYVPYLDCGDNVVVIHAQQVALSRKKQEKKIYTRYSGYPGGLKEIPFQKMREQKPQDIIKFAVSGMLPDNKLKKTRLQRLYVYKDEKHPYANKFTDNDKNIKS